MVFNASFSALMGCLSWPGTVVMGGRMIVIVVSSFLVIGKKKRIFQLKRNRHRQWRAKKKANKCV
jgi:hypothetical protein